MTVPFLVLLALLRLVAMMRRAGMRPSSAWPGRASARPGSGRMAQLSLTVATAAVLATSCINNSHADYFGSMPRNHATLNSGSLRAVGVTGRVVARFMSEKRRQSPTAFSDTD